MLHLLMDNKPWFTARRSRWHSRPATWQAHMLMVWRRTERTHPRT
jgi:hypothetical protein